MQVGSVDLGGRNRDPRTRRIIIIPRRVLQSVLLRCVLNVMYDYYAIVTIALVSFMCTRERESHYCVLDRQASQSFLSSFCSAALAYLAHFGRTPMRFENNTR